MLGHVYIQFLKTIFYFGNQIEYVWGVLIWFMFFEKKKIVQKTRTMKIEKSCLVPTKKTLNLENKNNFQITPKWYSLYFQKHELNMPLIPSLFVMKTVFRKHQGFVWFRFL